jgi:tetratricopeptide (TPR) repeat protein
LRAQGWTTKQIAVEWQDAHRFNARAAFRLANGLTQQDVADRWNEQWPSVADTPKTAKHIAYWEAWPSPSGRAPSLETLNRLAFIYRCSAADLLAGADYTDYTDDSADDSDGDGSAGSDEHPRQPAARQNASGSLLYPTALPSAVHSPVMVSGILDLNAALTAAEAGFEEIVQHLRVMAYHMKRRNFLQLLSRASAVAGAVPLFGGLDQDMHERLIGVVRDPARVDAAVLDNIGRILHYCRRQDDSLGPHAVLDTVLAQTHLAQDILSGGPPEQLRPRLLSLLAELHQCAGWLLFDLDDRESALRCYEKARREAHDAGNTALASYVLCTMSHLATWWGSPREGIDHAIAARGWAAQTDSARARVYAADVLARAYAEDGQHALAQRALEESQVELDAALRVDSDPQVPALYFYDQHVYWGTVAECALKRRDPVGAVAMADQAITGANQSAIRNNAFHLLFRAEGYLQQREIEAACADLREVLSLMAINGSARVEVRLCKLRQRINPTVRTAALRELDERLAAYGLR